MLTGTSPIIRAFTAVVVGVTTFPRSLHLIRVGAIRTAGDGAALPIDFHFSQANARCSAEAPR